MANHEKIDPSLSDPQDILAINGGKAVRTEPLPLEFPGVHHMGEEEVSAALGVVRSPACTGRA
jgi:hypothetical protein